LLAYLVRKHYKNSISKPDVILVDGGITQVNFSEKELIKEKIYIPVVGLTKNKKHVFEKLFYKNQKIEISNKKLKNFLIFLQEKAHKYVNNYFRKTFKRSLFENK
jgi:excinuclease ABC subunit C